MKHNLEAINAANALGDRFVLPVGVVVEFDDSELLYKITEVVYPRDGIIGAYYYMRHYKSDRVSLRAANSSTLVKRIYYIPDDAPPFEEWRRVPT